MGKLEGKMVLPDTSYLRKDLIVSDVIYMPEKTKLLEEAEKNTDLDMFECPFPVKYVLENGYRIYKDHVICEGKYDMIFGLMIDKKWYEI